MRGQMLVADESKRLSINFGERAEARGRSERTSFAVGASRGEVGENVDDADDAA